MTSSFSSIGTPSAEEELRGRATHRSRAMTDDPLKSIVKSIEGLEEKQKALLKKKRGIYTEAKKANPDLNTKALRKIIAERRMPDREQVEAAMHNYRVALGMAVNDVANGATLRQAADRHGVRKSAVHRAVPREARTELGHRADDGLDVPKQLDQRRERPST